MRVDIRAIIMAGGEGVRLRPMTIHCPKPLVPLLGRPVMAYTLQLLKKHNISRVGVTLWYQPKKIRAAFGEGEKEGMKISYFEETEPLGTAGSVRMTREHIKDTFFVLSGDGLTDCDLTAALAYHKKKKALATLVLKKVQVPLAYGAVMTDRDGRITRFVEKPDWSRAFTNLVNTGIYILEPEIFSYIPENGMPDFGKDVFPSLLAAGKKLYGYEMDGYWCDVGNQEAYLEAQKDLLRGKVALDADKGIHPEAKLSHDVHLRGHFYIGRDAVIEKGAVIKDAVIGQGCRVGAGAVIENSCLWENAGVSAKARLEGSVLCNGAKVMGGAVLENGCAVGSEARVGAHVNMHPGVKIWPDIRVTSGAVLRESRQRQAGCECLWEEDMAVCPSADAACRLTQVYLAATGIKTVITAHRSAQGMQAVATGTAALGGANVMSGENASLPMLQEAVHILHADGGILAAADGLYFLEKEGMPLSSQTRRKMEGLLQSGWKNEKDQRGDISFLAGMEEICLAALTKGMSRKALKTPIAVFCADAQVLHLAENGLKRIGVEKIRTGKGASTALRKGEVGFIIADDGRDLGCITENGPIEKTQLQLLRLKMMKEKGDKVYDLEEVPRCAGIMFPLHPKNKSEACLQQERRMGDGVAGLLQICDAMKEETLENMLQKLPGAHVVCREVDCRDTDKARILHALCCRAALPYTLERGMQVQHENGYASIVPHQTRPSVRITGEAETMEAANELCDFYDREIRRALENDPDR